MYTLIETMRGKSVLKQNADGSQTSIPFDPANTDYAQFKKAVLDGAKLQDAEGKTMSAEQATQFVKELP